MYKIFLDDLRPVPKDVKDFMLVRSYENCVLMLDIYGDDLERIDLDYDLGISGETGLEVLVYMNKNNINPRYINIHSDHPTGSREMVKYAEEHFTESIISSRKAE